jgi:hypothetical protein
MSQPLQKISKPSLSLFHPPPTLVHQQNCAPLAGAEDIGLSPRRKTPKPDGIFSLAPSLFLSPH